jgi:hypothetical protein
MPLGHPAHVLSEGKASIAAGVAGTVIAASPRAANAETARLQDLTVAPDVSPWVSARAGFGDGFEAGLGASSRAIRIDARRAFASEPYAFSIGFGASAILAAPPGSGEPATGVYGGGFDVPLLFGWHSSADLYALWIGPRIGADFFSGSLDAGAAEPLPASGRHLHFGGVAGLRGGFRRVFVVVEVETAYHRADGTLGTSAVALDGWTVAPAGALVVSF